MSQAADAAVFWRPGTMDIDLMQIHRMQPPIRIAEKHLASVNDSVFGPSRNPKDALCRRIAERALLFQDLAMHFRRITENYSIHLLQDYPQVFQFPAYSSLGTIFNTSSALNPAFLKYFPCPKSTHCTHSKGSHRVVSSTHTES
jgi:hypothetical protein